MAEAIALGASVITVIQIADRIIGICKSYIETGRDAPSDLRVILLETSTLKTILENLEFLTRSDGLASSFLRSISSPDGMIEECLRSMKEMEGLFPAESRPAKSQAASKKRKIQVKLSSLAWPLKEKKARKLLDQIVHYKSTISLAMTSESM